MTSPIVHDDHSVGADSKAVLAPESDLAQPIFPLSWKSLENFSMACSTNSESSWRVGMRADRRGEEIAGVTGSHYLSAAFGASEATILSKRGSPRSGSQYGNSLSWP